VLYQYSRLIVIVCEDRIKFIEVFREILSSKSWHLTKYMNVINMYTFYLKQFSCYKYLLQCAENFFVTVKYELMF
jgi:hypothetical protein